MRTHSVSEAISILGWTSNFHSDRYLVHPDLPLRATLDWETSHIGDLKFLAEQALRMFGDITQLLHWTAYLGYSSCLTFERAIFRGLGASDEVPIPFVASFEAVEVDLFTGFLTHRMQTLGDHTLLSPRHNFAIGFSNDGECLFYARSLSTIAAVRHGLCALGDEVKILPNQAPEPTTMSVTPPAVQEPRQP